MEFGQSNDLRMLHIYMLDYMRMQNMNESAEAFAREAGLSSARSLVNPPDGFLCDWWCLFWDVFNSRMYGRYAGGECEAESSAQAEYRAWANNGMEASQLPFDATWHASNQQSLIPGYMNMQQGWALPDSYSSNSRHNLPQRHRIAEVSSLEFRRVSSQVNQSTRPTPRRAARRLNLAIRGPRNARLRDLNISAYYDIWMAIMLWQLSIGGSCTLVVQELLTQPCKENSSIPHNTVQKGKLCSKCQCCSKSLESRSARS